MSLYPILWAVDHAPVRDAEERAILVALVIKGDFDGCNCFRSYKTLAEKARIDPKTVGRRCRDMEKRGLLKRQTRHLSKAWLAIPKEQRPVPWEVMIPVEFWSSAQLADLNEHRASLGREPLTRENRPPLAEAPLKRARTDKGTPRPKKDVHAGEQGDGQSGDPGTTSPGGDPGTDSPHPRDSQSPPPGLVVPQPSESPSESPSENKDAVGDARRASAGSSARDARGGSAATGKTRSSAKVQLTREQAAAVAFIEASLPEGLVEELRGKSLMGRYLPASVRLAIVKQLADRTPEQLAARVARRWVRHGYADALRSLNGKGLASPLGVVHALVRAGECPDLGCEDGVMVDTGADCRACEGRKDGHRRGERKTSSMPRQRQVTPTWTCSGCFADSFTPPPAELQCATCAAKTQAAFRELAARLQADALLIDTPDRCEADGVPWSDEEPPDPDEPDEDPYEDEQAPQALTFDDIPEEASH